MTKAPSAFRSIGEVARMVGIAPHVLRYWQTQFPALVPVTRADGRRYYRPDDIALIAGISEALRDDGLTIRGANKLIARDRGAALRAKGFAWLDRTAAQSDDIAPGGSGRQSRRRDSSDAGGRPLGRTAPGASGEVAATGRGSVSGAARGHMLASVGADGGHVTDTSVRAAAPGRRGARTGDRGASGSDDSARGTLPLFPDPAPLPAPCLLERLNATLSRLRSTEAALPPDAEGLAVALRRALNARGFGGKALSR